MTTAELVELANGVYKVLDRAPEDMPYLDRAEAFFNLGQLSGEIMRLEDELKRVRAKLPAEEGEV